MSDPRTAEFRQEVENDDAAIPKCVRCQGTGEVPTVHAMPTGDGPYPIFGFRTCPAASGAGVKSTKGKEHKP
jgi:hypothetical protein